MSIPALLRRALDAACTLVFPPHCAGCDTSTESGVIVCGTCLKGARRIEAPFCRQCSQPFDGEFTSEFTCSNCRDRRFHFECAVTPYLARGVVRDLIHRFKYQSQYYLRQRLADWAAEGLDDDRIVRTPFDAFVPVPLHSTRQREREFNQAEALGELLAKRSGRPMVNALQRLRYTTTQTRLDRAARMENLHGAFRVRKRELVLNRHLILVDDVFTTGSTVEECARVLREAGAASVRALTIARG